MNKDTPRHIVEVDGLVCVPPAVVEVVVPGSGAEPQADAARLAVALQR